MPQTEIQKLTSTVNDFIIASTKSNATLKANQVNLTKSMDEMTASVRKSVESNARLEFKLESLETKAIDRLDNVELEVSALNESVKELEIFKATCEGIGTSNDKHERRVFDSWSKALGALAVAAAIFGSILAWVK